MPTYRKRITQRNGEHRQLRNDSIKKKGPDQLQGSISDCDPRNMTYASGPFLYCTCISASYSRPSFQVEVGMERNVDGSTLENKNFLSSFDGKEKPDAGNFFRPWQLHQLPHLVLVSPLPPGAWSFGCLQTSPLKF
jgi:hypothetical protein